MQRRDHVPDDVVWNLETARRLRPDLHRGHTRLKPRGAVPSLGWLSDPPSIKAQVPGPPSLWEGLCRSPGCSQHWACDFSLDLLFDDFSQDFLFDDVLTVRG